MPKRVIDFDAMWGSDKLASCASWAQAEYAWFYGLADASGCFELTNLRVIWGRVAAVRHNLSLERLEQIFHEFHDKGLLFIWEENGKRYGHWTGSDVPGRLPAPSWRARLERLAPPVPKQQFVEFMSRFSRGRAASPGGGFRDNSSQGEPQRAEKHFADEDFKAGLECPQGQDWKWNKNKNQKREECAETVQSEVAEETSKPQPSLLNLSSRSKTLIPEPASTPTSQPALNQSTRVTAAGAVNAGAADYARLTVNAQRERDKSLAVSRELVVGQGPQCGPVRVKPEVLARIRARDNSRSP